MAEEENISINQDDKTPLIKDEVVEVEPEKPIHWISMISIMAVGFIANVEYGIVMPSINEFIISKDSHFHGHISNSSDSSESQSDSYLGWALSGFSLTQLVFLPIVGIWADKRTIREAISVCIMIGIIGNIIYATAINPIMIVMGRVIAGIGSSNMALTNSYIAAITTKEQRTRYMGKINGINAIGLVAGPAFNLLLSVTNFTIKIKSFEMKVTPLNSPGYMLAFFLLCCLISFIWFKEPPRGSTDATDEEKQSLVVPGGSGALNGSSLYRSGRYMGGSQIYQSSNSNYNNSNQQAANQEDVHASITQITSASAHLSFNYKSIAKSVSKIHKSNGGAMNYKEDKETFWTNLKKLLNASLLTCFVINFVQNFVFGALETMITPMTSEQYGFKTLSNSVMYSVVSAEIIVFIFATVAASNMGIQDKFLVLFGQCFLGAGLTMLFIFFGVPANRHVDLWKFCLSVAITTVGIPTQNTSIYSLYSKLLNRIFGEDEQQGFQTGFMMLMGSLARIVGPLWASYGLTMSNRFPLFLVLLAMWVFDIGVTLIFFGKLTFITKPGQKAMIVAH
ncbi:hypothetical protein PPL_05785 [Heterostelium album PN500]|uniref:Major facilitator superfamily (MFS) profile domain-containing protein n=1 Tax=Heterostelium pallidum (strain ATCC 26659 / Pp 5 / PN500) TaxID=670386 RepID=D3BB53_HETP5|nr:hypothetical protein PPL_05785 [Heterostelium album PN500]EFA81790.1 hypothetical protein PPL_05785 [Heterostelium album PN500]|eukprot:XP_020433907.1 hypothetical protein PPL_05785 [Heterostelium album PN500]